MNTQRWIRLFLVVALALSFASIALWTLSQFSDFQVQDDGFMFARYARNLREQGGLVWNRGEPPTYGATSLLYVAFLTLVSTALPSNVSLITAMGSFLCGLAALFVVARLAVRGAARDRASLLWIGALVFVPIAMSAEHIAAHITNGMDTTFAMAMVGTIVLLWTKSALVPAGSGGVVLGLFGGLLFATRPDLALYALGIPAVVAFIERGDGRKRALVVLATTLAWIALQSFACWRYFGTPVPLAFYIKASGNAYGDAFRAKYLREPFVQVANFVRGYWIWFLLIGVDLALHRRELLRPERALRSAVTLATFAHIGYYTFGVLQVVGFHQRFYHPTLPALAYLAATASFDLARSLRMRGRRAPEAAHLLIAIAAAIGPLPAIWRGEHELEKQRALHTVLHFDVFDRYRTHPNARHVWLGLDRLADIGDDLVLATTEVGHPAVMLPHARVIDLAGLNETEFALHGFSAERLFGVLSPDWIYLPHPDYESMNRALRGDPRFQKDYEVFEAEELGTLMGVAIKKSSAHHDALLRIVTESRAANH